MVRAVVSDLFCMSPPNKHRKFSTLTKNLSPLEANNSRSSSISLRTRDVKTAHLPLSSLTFSFKVSLVALMTLSYPLCSQNTERSFLLMFKKLRLVDSSASKTLLPLLTHLPLWTRRSSPMALSSLSVSTLANVTTNSPWTANRTLLLLRA